MRPADLNSPRESDQDQFEPVVESQRESPSKLNMSEDYLTSAIGSLYMDMGNILSATSTGDGIESSAKSENDQVITTPGSDPFDLGEVIATDQKRQAAQSPQKTVTAASQSYFQDDRFRTTNSREFSPRGGLFLLPNGPDPNLSGPFDSESRVEQNSPASMFESRNLSEPRFVQSTQESEKDATFAEVDQFNQSSRSLGSAQELTQSPSVDLDRTNTLLEAILLELKIKSNSPQLPFSRRTSEVW
jgi:hypothetical protein